MRVHIRFKGGEGSGNYGHAGRPGEVGGSQPTDTAVAEPLSNKYPKANPDGKDTMEQYMNADGTWTKERQALHAKIINSFFEGKTPVDSPTSYMLGGGPASGKSTLLKSGMVTLPDNIVLANPDEVKTMLPEFENGKGSAFVHEESSYVAKQIIQRAASQKYNVVVDGTGDGGIEGLMKKVKTLSQAGAPVRGIYVTVDTDVAVARSLERAKKTGRWVPESFIRESHAAISAVFPTIAMSGVMDSIDLYDTNYGKAIRIAHATGRKLVIDDDGLWKRFLAKAFVKKG